mmetsp:Transcript_11787/g.37448  ORF Transcript_11787/g.37448 Transcript_11787/m.37448 type:complete len:259 (+) Transcript_11787:3489-4265(+)
MREDAEAAVRGEREPARLPDGVRVVQAALVLEVGPALLEQLGAAVRRQPLLAHADVLQHDLERTRPRPLLLGRLGRKDPVPPWRGDLEAVSLWRRCDGDRLSDRNVYRALASCAGVRVKVEQALRREQDAEAPLEARRRGLALLVQPTTLELRHLQVRKQLVQLAPPRVQQLDVRGAQRVRAPGGLDLEAAAAVRRVDKPHLVREADLHGRDAGRRLEPFKCHLTVGVEAEERLLPLLPGLHLHARLEEEGDWLAPQR